MKLLSDRPNLEFLRKEAKDLLAVLRETKPDASLADAQRALAAEYGLRDWPALKAERPPGCPRRWRKHSVSAR
jgi:hypothetical protein